MFLDADLVARLRDSGLHAVVQPPFLAEQGDDLGYLPLPPALALMPFATLLEQGVPLALSSDFPVADCDPLLGMRAAVSRRSRNGMSLGIRQALTPEQALRGYTLAAAAALGIDDETGSTTPGKLADLTLLTHDPTSPGGLDACAWSRTWTAGQPVSDQASEPH
jgi:predicted amidohydrolase YtcJ